MACKYKANLEFIYTQINIYRHTVKINYKQKHLAKGRMVGEGPCPYIVTGEV